MSQKTFILNLLVLTGVLLVPLSPAPLAAQGSAPGVCNLPALSLALKLRAKQVKQAETLIHADEAVRAALRIRRRAGFERLRQLVRSPAPDDSYIKDLCRELAGIDEELIFHNAKTQVALRKILDPQQVAKLNRLMSLDSGHTEMSRRK